ncbi:phosphoglycerate kinase [Candidatus Parcubacteria bacterium]|nr:phosphoglycerate kinase [Candidatus Parcubacteria bacterium]
MWRTLDNLDVSGKRVFWRVDFNVPLGRDGEVDRFEDWRMAAALPTLDELLRRDARVIVASHLGEPDAPDPRWSLAPVARHLAKLTGRRVEFTGEITGPEVEVAVRALKPGGILMLENLRFAPGETANDPSFAQALAALAQQYVSDAFGTAHRDHASLTQVARLLPAAAGELMVAEINHLTDFLKEPRRPAVAVFGGAKAEAKLPALARLLPVVDQLLLGGVLANTMLARRGLAVGSSPVAKDAADALGELDQYANKILLPVDGQFALPGPSRMAGRTANLEDIQTGEVIFDIGPETARRYGHVLATAGSVLWNGPVGVIEEASYGLGTKLIAQAIDPKRTAAVVGGGDTVMFLKRENLLGRFGHVSTGGGAMLEFVAGNRLPALEALGYYS